MTKRLYRYNMDFGRMGMLDGAFIATPEEIEQYADSEVYLDEPLGKHSELSFTLKEAELTQSALSPAIVEALYEEFGNTIAGYNLLEIAMESAEF